jgi:hypothetical protein
VALQAVARLEHGRVRERIVERGNPRVRAVVGAAVHPDRPVDAMDHAHARAREASKAVLVERERVEEAGGRALGQPVLLEGETAPAELPREGVEELVTAAGRGGPPRVEHGEVGAARAPRAHLDLGAHAPGDEATRPARVDERRARLRPDADRHDGRTVEHVGAALATLNPCISAARSSPAASPTRRT